MTVTSSHIREDLRESRERLFASIHGLSEEQFRHVPEGETWCIATHLAHLLRCERLYTSRVQRALTQDEPVIGSLGVTNDDDPGLAQRLAVPQMIHGMLNARRELETLLEGSDEAAMDRGIIHEKNGRMTVAAMARQMADHEAEHVLEVARLVKQAPASARIPAGAPKGVIIPLARRS